MKFEFDISDIKLTFRIIIEKRKLIYLAQFDFYWDKNIEKIVSINKIIIKILMFIKRHTYLFRMISLF